MNPIRTECGEHWGNTANFQTKYFDDHEILLKQFLSNGIISKVSEKNVHGTYHAYSMDRTACQCWKPA